MIWISQNVNYFPTFFHLNIESRDCDSLKHICCTKCVSNKHNVNIKHIIAFNSWDKPQNTLLCFILKHIFVIQDCDSLNH